MKASVITLGCKVNLSESQLIMAQLKKLNIEVSDKYEYADIYIINTCSVTNTADKKSRQAVTKAVKFNPDSHIIVSGCSVENNSKNYIAKPNVIYLCGNKNKIDSICGAVSDIINTKYSITSVVVDNFESSANNKTRAFVKVQDGCNNFCTYCIVPYLRGRERSVTVDEVLEQVKNITSKELVITGINLSSYGKDIGSSLTELVKSLSAVKARKRLSSLECHVIDEDLLKAMRDSDFCDHFHLSLQSGSEKVLRDMNRHYDCEFFYKKVELIRQYFPDASITTDIIAGFPTETEDDFFQTLEFAKKVKFADIHAFAFSQRTGTKAAELKPIEPEIIKQRTDKLLQLKEQLKLEFLNRNLERTVEVYVEANEGKYNTGYSSNYIKVYTKADLNGIYNIKLKEIFLEGVKGYE